MDDNKPDEIFRNEFVYIEPLVLSQIAQWKNRSFDRMAAGAWFFDCNEKARDIFLFHVVDNIVSIEKKSHFSHEAYKDLVDGHVKRAVAYRKFYQEVLDCYPITGNFSFLMTMEDRSVYNGRFPVIAYQKKRGSNPILVPDIDSLFHGFYEHLFIDLLTWEQKAPGAVFFGSTTGGINSINKILTKSNERVGLAIRFKNSADIEFRLPNITQCDSPETARFIHDLGLAGDRMDWTEQLDYRCIISVDGNGATCSRIIIALKSNSILLKYKSDNVLYYFDAMQNYRTHIEVYSAIELESVARNVNENWPAYSHIANGGREFYEKYLKKAPSLYYTFRILQNYQEMFHDAGRGGDQSRKTSLRLMEAGFFVEPNLLGGDAVGVIRRRGEVIFPIASWVGVSETEHGLNAFKLPAFKDGNFDIYLSGSTSSDGISYSEYLDCRSWIGEPGHDQLLKGISFYVAGSTRNLACEYMVEFSNGVILFCRENEVASLGVVQHITRFAIRVYEL